MRYGLSLAVILATTGLIAPFNSDWPLFNHLTIENPGTVFIASVTLVAILVGTGPALLAIGASMLAVFLVFSRYESFERAVVLVATALIIIGLAEWQRRAQDAAERAQAKFAAIMESMSDAVMAVDMAGHATDLNQAAIVMLGAADRADAVARLTNRRADGTPSTDEYGLLARALAGERSPQCDVPIPDAPGGPRVVSAVANPVRDADGRIIGAVSVSRDMTDRLAQIREREALLRRIEQEQQFTTQVLDNVPVGIAVVRADDFTVLSFNNEYDLSIRHAPGSQPLMIGRSLLAAMPAASHDAATRLLSRARDEGTVIRTIAYAAAVVPDQFYDGTIQPLQLGDGTPALLITAVNVTERVQGEREREQLLRTIEQEQRYTQLILDTAPVAIGVVRPDDLMVASANDVFETYVSELAGKPFAAGASLMEALPGYETSEFVRQLRAAAAEDRTLSVTGYAARFPEGRYYDWTMKPLAFGDETRATLVTFADVTERMRGEQERERLLALVEERRRFTQAIFDIVPVCLAVVDTDAMVFSAANPAFIAATPEAFHHAGVGGRALTTVLPHTEENGFVAQLRATGHTGEPFEALATMYVHPTRGTTYWNETMIPLTSHDSDAHHVLYIAADVTEEIEAQERVAAHARAAAERASQLEAVFGALTEGLILIDAERTIVRSNAAVGRIFGLDDEPLPPLATFGERFAIHDQDGAPIPQHERAAVTALRGETRTDQLRRFRNARGEERWMSVSTVPVRDETEAITGVVMTIRDVTEERRGIEERERLLREVEERRQFAQTIIDSALTGIAVCAVDADFTILLANEQFRTIVGEAWEQPSLNGVPFHAFTPNAESAGILPIFRHVAAAGEPVTLSEFEYAGSGDHLSYFDWSLVPLRAGGDAVTSLVLLVTDVTDRVLSRQRIEELADAAAQRAAELEAVIANMPDGVAIYGANGQLMQMNRAGREISGEAQSPDDALPDVVEHFQLRYPDGRLIPLDDLPLPRALRGETVSGYEFISRTRRGDRNILTSGAPITSALGEITSAVIVFSDITERRRAEEMATRLGRILDASSNEFYVYDAETLRFLQVNAGAQRNLGYTMEEFAQMTPLDIRPEFSPESFTAIIAPLRAGERDEVVFETTHRRKDGSDYPVEARLRLSRSENPPVFVSIVQDITERYAAEQQREQLLREIDERRRFVQTIVESAPVGIAVFGTDAALTARMVNDQYLQLLDAAWRDTGIIGHGMREFVPDADAVGLTALARQVIERGETIALREFAFDGFARGTGYFDASIVPLRESGAQVTGILTVVADVTERVRSRQRIEELAWDAAQRASELETVIASIADGVMVTDADGRIILENAAARRLTGRSESAVSLDLEAQVARHTLRDPDGMPIPPTEIPLGRAVRGETVAEQVVIACRVDTEEDRFLMCSSAPVRAGNGAITGAVAVFRDITEMKQIDQMKDEFISIAAHELRTPLTAIKGYAELLERRLSTQAGRENDRRSLAVIRKQTERLAGLVNEMLDVSRIEAGRLQLNNEPFDLSALVEEVVNNMRISRDAHRFSLAAEPGVAVDGDTARIEQVLLNLLTNATTYAPEGGEIAVRVWRDAGAALVSVHDQGIGIAADELPHLFDRFYRSPHAEIMRSGGMGLGLYISREIITRHGGTIWAESAAGAGSTFTFSLPLIAKD